MSNYPPGVTGNEYEIAGPDAEWTDIKEVYCNNDECADFEKELEVEMDLRSYRGEWWGDWKCDTCGRMNDISGVVEDDRDYEPDDYPYWD